MRLIFKLSLLRIRHIREPPGRIRSNIRKSVPFQISNDSNLKDNYKKGNKTFFTERLPKSIESTLFHGSGDYFVLAPINTNLAPN